MNHAIIPPLPISEFWDRFSPMLVKELRQGLRTRIFTAAFIVIQVVMVLISLLSTIAANEGENLMAFTGMFWTMLSLLLLVVMPLRGFSALSNEMRDGTLETVLLTHLSAWRIAYGKWLALFSQTVLICLALMPYIVLRYFLGGTDLLIELMQFLTLLLLSGFTTAIAVGVSSQKSVLLRLVLLIVPFVLCFSLTSGTVFLRSGVGGGGPFSPFFLGSSPWLVFMVFVVTICFLTYYALDMGATFIAPEAENHSTRKRLIGIAVVFFNISLMWLTDLTPEFLFAIISVILTLISFDALTERATLVPSVYDPFFRRGRWGRWAALFLCPGWAHGSFFLLICVGLWSLSLFQISSVELEELATFLMIISVLILPTALISIASPNKRSFTLYIVIQCCVWGLGLMISAFDQMIGGLMFLGSPLPPVSWIMVLSNEASEFGMFMLVVVFGISIIVATIHGRRHFNLAARMHANFERSQMHTQEGEST